MSPTRRIYRLSPSQFSPETIAVTFAKTSRSPEPFDVIAAELDNERSARFSEKWIVGYGHSSVAEHAVLHLALENVSRLAIETVEGNRLGSYTEKSSRYQEWDAHAYTVPAELEASPYRQSYVDLMDQLFAAYADALGALRAWGEAHTPKLPEETDKSWANRVRAAAIDTARFLLPAGAVANVGVTMNARVLEYAIRKLLSSDLAEARVIGEEIKAVAAQELPTLVKYANPIDYLPAVRELSQTLAGQIEAHPVEAWCRLTDFDLQAEDKTLAAILFRFGISGAQDCLSFVKQASPEERAAWANQFFGQIGAHNTPLRELEFAQYQFELVMDQGAYFEFKRHRMMTQTVQSLNTHLGYAVPRAICDAGFENRYHQAMAAAARGYELLAAWNRPVASYVVPNGYNRRVLCGVNLRELYHFISLRCAENAHYSIRRVGRGMLEALQAVHPLLASQIRVNESESSQSIAGQYFSALAEPPHLS